MSRLSRLTVAFGAFLVITIQVGGQINNTLYFMNGVPQSNRINPAIQPDCGFYFGIPGLAPLRVQVSSSSLSFDDLIYPHPTADSLITFLHPLGDKQAFLDILDPVNFVLTDFGTSLLSLGVRTAGGFFSLDITTRAEAIVSYPGDLARFALNGAVEGETYTLDGMGTDLTLYNELSVGWSSKIMENLTVGVRAKALFGMANMGTTKSELSVTTSQDMWHIHSDMQFNSSLPVVQFQYDQDGLIDSVVTNNDFKSFDPFVITRYGFNIHNFGAGLDVGVNFRPIEPLTVSLSVLDFGFIHWTDEVTEARYELDYDFTGLELNIDDFSDEFTFGDYLDSTFESLADTLTGALTFSSGNPYTQRLTTKLFVGATYYITPKINFGILSRTDFLDNKVSPQVTATANFTTGRMVNFTLSYSYINAYYKNIGAGLAFNLGPFNLYLVSDNLGNVLLWPQEARSVNLWFGMNAVFGYRKFMQKKAADRPLIYTD